MPGTGLDAYPVLERTSRQRLRATFEIERVDVRKMADRRLWKATYEARILALCASD